MSNKVIDINNVCFHYQEQKNASLTHVNLQIIYRLMRERLWFCVASQAVASLRLFVSLMD